MGILSVIIECRLVLCWRIRIVYPIIDLLSKVGVCFTSKVKRLVTWWVFTYTIFKSPRVSSAQRSISQSLKLIFCYGTVGNWYLFWRRNSRMPYTMFSLVSRMCLFGRQKTIHFFYSCIRTTIKCIYKH